MKYLDKDGLSYFWSKIKGWVNSSAHPVGTIYMTASNTFDPNKTWGGTWTKWADGRVPLAANSTYPLGSTGGANTHSHVTKSHTLTNDEIPAHSHDLHGWVFNGLNNVGKRYGLSANYGGAQPGGGGQGDNFSTYASLNNAEINAWKIINAGGGKSHDHGSTDSSSTMQPYRSVNIWQRTA